MKIITSLYIDKSDYSKNPQLAHLNFNNKRIAYWECCVTFFSSSIKVNPKDHHILYTNDKSEIVINNRNIKDFLNGLGVEIIYLPFIQFNVPNKFSSYLSAAFYKLEVLYALRQENTDDICLLDSDCIWIRPADPIKKILLEDKIILYDIYKLKDNYTESPHGLSKKDLYDVFNQVLPNYPNPEPIRYGGEIVASNAKNFKKIADTMISSYNRIIKEFTHLPKFKNGKKFLDGMEFFTSFVYNMIEIEHVDTEEEMILKRIWTRQNVNTVSKSNLDLVIWHLIAEKGRGIHLLCKEVLNEKSNFWNIGLDQMPEYLGGYMGIPERKIKMKELSFLQTIIPTIKNKIKEKITALR